MTPLERKKIQDRIQQEFNMYKSAGSTLLQTGKIDAPEYYERVRNKGIKLGLIGEDEYPTTLPSSIEPVMRVTGATIGALAGIPLGLGGISAGAGVGGALATAAFQEFSEFFNPDLPMMPIGQKMKRAGTAGAVDFAGTLAFGGAGNVIGNVITKSKNISQKGLKNLGEKTDEQLSALGANIPEREVGPLQRLFVSTKNDNKKYMDKVAAELEEQGLTPYLALVSRPTIRAYFEAAGRMPLIGTPQRRVWDENMNNLVTRLVDGVKRFDRESKASGLKPLLSEGKFTVTPTGRIEVADNIPISQLQQQQSGAAITALSNRILDSAANKKEAYNIFDKGMRTVKNVNLQQTVNIGTETAPVNQQLSKLLSTSPSNPLFARANAPEFNAGKQFSKDLREVLSNAKIGQNVDNLTGVQTQRLYTELRKKIVQLESRESRGQIGQEVIDKNIKTSLEQFRTLQSALLQRLQGVKFRDGGDAGAILTQANSLNEILKNNIALNAPLLSYLGKSNTLVKSLGNDLDGSMDDLVRESGFQFAAKSAKDKKTDVELITTYFDDFKMQGYLSQALGKDQYKKMVQTDIDDIFERSLFKNINAKGTLKDTDLRKDLGLDGNSARSRLIQKRLEIAFGNQGKEMYKELDKFVNILKYLPDNPKLNEFVTRRAALMAAGSTLGVGALGVGVSMAGGPIAGLASLGLAFGFSQFLALPYGKRLLAQAQANTFAGRQAADKVLNDIANLSGPANRANKSKAQGLAVVNQAAYKKYLEFLRQSGIELGNDELFPNANSNFYGETR